MIILSTEKKGITIFHSSEQICQEVSGVLALGSILRESGVSPVCSVCWMLTDGSRISRLHWLSLPVLYIMITMHTNTHERMLGAGYEEEQLQNKATCCAILVMHSGICTLIILVEVWVQVHKKTIFSCRKEIRNSKWLSQMKWILSFAVGVVAVVLSLAGNFLPQDTDNRPLLFAD